jgi:hypothetical protein
MYGSQEKDQKSSLPLMTSLWFASYRACFTYNTTHLFGTILYEYRTYALYSTGTVDKYELLKDNNTIDR